MGHGLIAVPRRLYRNANIGLRLRRIQSHAPSVHERRMKAISELEELESQLTQLRQRKAGVSRDHQEWIKEIADGSDLPEARLLPVNPQPPRATIPVVITDRYLAGLARRLNRARHKRLRFIDTWDNLIQDAVDTQAILDSSASKQLDFGPATPALPPFERLRILTPYTRHLLHYHIFPKCRVLLAAVLSLASLCIIWSELVKYIAPQLSIIRFTVVSHRRVHFAGQMMASLWMSYMCTAALASFGDIKVWGNRALVKRNTYGESATWYAGQVAKLTVPLAYNFLTFLPPDVHRETTFYKFLGQLINLTPLGKGFEVFLPIFILVPVCATLFNLYGRIKGTFRIDFVEYDDEGNSSSGTANWRDGRDLIRQELTGNVQPGLGSRPPRPPSQPYRDSVPSDSTRNAPPSSITHPPIAPQPNNEQRQTSRLAATTAAAEEEDESLFQGFAHR
ncbi:MAG: hypothetical protein Q9196_005679, partial [Gyalolechia fulgens]